MKRKSAFAFKVFAGIACFLGFLTVSSEFSRSQSEKPGIRSAWNPEKQILLATTVPVPSRPLRLEVSEFMRRETQKEKIPTQEITPPIPTVKETAKRGVKKARLSPLELLDHTELQARVNDLDYEILPGKGVRFRYSGLLYERMGHEWFLKKPRDLRGKTVRIDYRGYVPKEITFRIAKSGTSAAVEKKVALEDSPYEPQSIFIVIPNTVPFKAVKHLEFWIERESAGWSQGDFMIEKVVVLERQESAKAVANESRPEPFPFDQPFVPTNLMRTEVRSS